MALGAPPSTPSDVGAEVPVPPVPAEVPDPSPEAVDVAPPPDKPLVLFVHGMHMTGASWAHWQERFEAAGFDTLAPSWPGREGEPAALRDAPDARLRELTLTEVVGMYRDVLAEQGERDVVLVGHSMGGLVVQLLLQEGDAAAAVAVDPAPPDGVNCFKWSFLKSNRRILAPTKAPLNPPFRWFWYAFANTLPEAAARQAFETYVVPESRLVGKGSRSRAAAIDFDADHPPLLLIAGDADHIIPPSLVDKVARRYEASPGATDLLHFEGRGHWIVAEPGWEEVADAVVGWIEGLGSSR